jgi:hypothetical protein
MLRCFPVDLLDDPSQFDLTLPDNPTQSNLTLSRAAGSRPHQLQHGLLLPVR